MVNSMSSTGRKLNRYQAIIADVFKKADGAAEFEEVVAKMVFEVITAKGEMGDKQLFGFKCETERPWNVRRSPVIECHFDDLAFGRPCGEGNHSKILSRRASRLLGGDWFLVDACCARGIGPRKARKARKIRG